MKSSLKAPTKAESRRMDIIKFEIGCLIHRGTRAFAHHLINPKTGRRISHMATIPLCPDCHVGPNSTHKRKVWFREKHGTDEKLLELTNELVAEFEGSIIGGKG